MTPEELAREIEDADSHDDDDTVILRVGMYRKLLATAEREAKLREAIETAIEDLIDGDAFVIDRLRADLESKGGDS